MATAVILDLDGTVWDSHPFYAAAVAGSDTAKEMRALAELKAAASAAVVLKSGGIAEGRFRAFCAANGSLTLYPGALGTLMELFEARTPLGAVTNLPAWIVEPMLACQGLEEMLGSLVTWGRTSRKKPWPDPLLLCCDELGVDADNECWYVGDTDGDCTAAKRAGLSFAWASCGYGNQAPTESDVTLERFSDIAEL